MASPLGLEAQAEVLAEMAARAEAMKGQVAVAWQASALVWRLSAAIVVFIMQLGFSLIEAGTVRYKNTRNIMLKNALDTCVSNIAFWVFGYALAFGEGTRFIGWKFPNGQVAFGQVQDPVFFFYQFVFVATSATIFAGAVAERTQISAYLLFNFFLAALIYPVVAHMLWSPYGLLSVESKTRLFGSVGVLDNAGSMVVHVTGGVTSLVAAWIVGPRLGRFDINGRPVRFRGHSMVFIAAGTLAIWVGFLGFNGGSVLLYPGEDPWAFVSRVAGSIANTVISGAGAGAACFAATYWRAEPCPEHTFNGVLGGLVAACATSSLVYAYAAFIIGVTAGLVYLLGVWVITDKARVDDPVHAAAVHLGCGAWGALSAGLWANPAYVRDTYHLVDAQVSSCGLFYGCGFRQLGVQVVALLLVLGWVGATSLVLFLVLNFFGLLRVNRQEEEVGLDIAFHGAGVTADEALDVAQMEEGGPGGPKLVALRARMATWRRMRALAQHRRPDPPAPSYSASRNTSLGSHHSLRSHSSANSTHSTPSQPSKSPLKGSPKSQSSEPKALSALGQALGLGLGGPRAGASSSSSGVPLVHRGEASGAATGTGGGNGGRGPGSQSSGGSDHTLNRATGGMPGGGADSLWRGVVSALEGPLSALAGVGARATGAVRQGLGGNARDVWHKELEATSLGQFSLAMYEANYVMEDAVEVHTAPEWVFLAVHDGHNGSEAAEFVRDTLWGNIRARCRAAGLPPGVASSAGISAGFSDTEVQFTEVVREAFDDSAPHLATVGACTAALLVTRKGLWAANVGDCRAVLGQLRTEGGEMEIRAVQMTQEHNLADAGVREAYRMQHLDMPDAVQYKRGSHRVKGRVTVTRCFGDLYLKSHEFNREPLVSRFRIPEPFNPPLLSAHPAVTCRTLAPHDAFVVLASDGLFEFLSNEEVVRIVATNPRKDIARTLVRSAVERAAVAREVPLADLLRKPSGDRRSFHDDISVIVFFLDHQALRAPRPLLWRQSTSYRGGSSTKGASDAPSAGLDDSILSSVHQALGPKQA